MSIARRQALAADIRDDDGPGPVPALEVVEIIPADFMSGKGHPRQY